jgi:hypothetical protein
MKRLRVHFLLVGAFTWMTACASIGPPLPPSLELPKPPVDLRAARKGDKVTLTWTVPARTTDRQSVRYLGKTRICRNVDSPLKQCETPVGEAAPPADFKGGQKSSAKKLTATFVDTLPSATEQEHPTGFAVYAVEVLNTAGKGAGLSNQVRVPLVPTLPPFSDFSTDVTAQGVMITWQCPITSERRREVTKYLLRIYRRPEATAGEIRIAEIDVTGCVANPLAEQDKTITSFLDQTFEWEKTYFYRAAAVSEVETSGKATVEVEGDDTPEVKVFAHDVFPPGVPAGLQAVFSGPGQQPFIDLIWAPVPDADLAGYNVYRHEDGGAAVKVNSEPVKTPAFRDTQVVSGKTYFYSVSAVDVRGNESGQSEEAGETVP